MVVEEGMISLNQKIPTGSFLKFSSPLENKVAVPHKGQKDHGAEKTQKGHAAAAEAFRVKLSKVLDTPRKPSGVQTVTIKVDVPVDTSGVAVSEEAVKAFQEASSLNTKVSDPNVTVEYLTINSVTINADVPADTSGVMVSEEAQKAYQFAIDSGHNINVTADTNSGAGEDAMKAYQDSLASMFRVNVIPPVVNEVL